MDFSSSEDVLNLSDLLSEMPADLQDDYILAEDAGGGDTILHISTTGDLTSDASGISGADQTILLEGVTYSDTLIEDLINSGHLDIE